MSVPVQTRAAAQERAVRTFFLGLGLDLAVAAATALLTWLPGADLSTRAAWIILATTLIKTILSTIGSYVLRLKLQPATEVDGAFDGTTLRESKEA
jgi:hypothetical protein